ncbi:hypothetical protein D9615_010012 [Tricholomella constricta]|uniref:Uncharacterized protein n=1 Tax=Tricholomella constricta TaxID=117010 RepID=A0A8H5GU76_9AGAR|nr:hypothetical protein D9615_010012 [Tricholomella constricta]
MTAPIAVPITATVVVIVWLYEMYKETRITLQRLMTYIVQLTLIMQIIFWLQGALKIEDQEISIGIIKLAIATYSRYGEKERIERRIKEYAAEANLTDRDAAFNEIVAVLKDSRINSGDELEERVRDELARFVPDEQWN